MEASDGDIYPACTRMRLAFFSSAESRQRKTNDVWRLAIASIAPATGWYCGGNAGSKPARNRAQADSSCARLAAQERRLAGMRGNGGFVS